MKNSLIKRIAAVAFAAATILTCAPTTSLAAGLPTIDTNKPVSLTITKFEGNDMALDGAVSGKEDNNIATGKMPIQGVEFTALKVADLDQDVTTGDTNVSLEYKLTADGAAILKKVGTGFETAAANDIVTGTRLNAYIKDRKAAEYDNQFSGNITTAVKGTTNDQGIVKFTSADGTNDVKLDGGQGLYLIVETFAPAQVTERSHPFFVSLPMTDKGNESEWQYDVFAYPKNSTATTNIDKQIKEVNGDGKNGIASDKHTAEAQIGDIITYSVPVTALVPDGGLTALGITDTMSKGLTFVKAGAEVASTDVTVYSVETGVDGINETVATDKYTVSLQDGSDGAHVLKVDFTSDYLNTVLNVGKDKNPKFIFEYKAILNENAVLGQTGNGNEVYFTYGYTNNSNVESEHKKTTVYTWGIDLTKQGENKETKLDNVEFTLKKDGAIMKFITKADGAYVPSSEQNASETLKTANQGKLIIRGLESGTYTLTETKTADGYVLLKEPVEIKITAKKDVNNAYTGAADVTVDGKTVTLGKDGTSENAFVPVTVVNHKGFDLPATGGAGTALFTIAGIAIVAVAAALLLMRKKSNK